MKNTKTPSVKPLVQINIEALNELVGDYGTPTTPPQELKQDIQKELVQIMVNHVQHATIDTLEYNAQDLYYLHQIYLMFCD